ncbi:MAG: hypothetical protein JF609_05530 [Verrucomicrobia bacterium]|nr:hypothetical protein [Verrucomicrobiota bacterium]
MTAQLERPVQAVYHKVAENLYRQESSGSYYALFKPAGKQIWKSLKTKDAALARRRLNELRDKVARLNQAKGASKLTFGDLAERWLGNHRTHLKDKSISWLDICLKGLKPYFAHVPVRNISNRQCEAWISGRGQEISPASYKHERRVLLSVLDFAMRDGLILENPARIAVPIRKVPKAKIIIPTREQFTQLVATIRSADVRAKPAGNLVELLGCYALYAESALPCDVAEPVEKACVSIRITPTAMIWASFGTSEGNLHAPIVGALHCNVGTPGQKMPKIEQVAVSRASVLGRCCL